MIRAFRRELTREAVDLVHVKTSSGINFHQNALYAWTARLAGLPVILQIHCGMFDEFHRENPALMPGWIRRTLTGVDRVAVLCRFWADRIAAIAPEAKVRVVPNGLEPAEFIRLSQGTRERKKQVFFIGAGDAEIDTRVKGLDDLLGLLPSMIRRHPETHWVVAGLHDPERARRHVEDQTGGFAGSGHLRFLGVLGIEERAALLKESSIFVLPSHYESMPNSLLEAMAAGTGVVASRVGAVPEMLGDGNGGCLFAPGDRKAFAAALDSLLATPGRAREQGDWNQKAVAQSYLLSDVERGLEKIYREAMTEHSESRRDRGMRGARTPNEASVPFQTHSRRTAAIT